MTTGLEIEVPFKFYYPNIYKDFFSSESYNQFSNEKLERFNNIISLEEPAVLTALTNFSNKFNLKRGRDKYWEFVFPPSDSIQEHNKILFELIKEKLIPFDMPLSLHITIGNIEKIKVYAILFFLELEFVDKNRILSGFGQDYDRLTWNRKGVAGVAKKYKINLIKDETAFEIRTLKVEPILIPKVLRYLEELFYKDNIIDLAKEKMNKMGLPFKIWNKEDFIKFSSFLKNN